MALPLIDIGQNVLGFYAGDGFAFQPGVFSDSSCVWSAIGLPSGVAIDSATARIYGAISTQGTYRIGLIGTNSTGASAVVFFTIGIVPGDVGALVPGSSDSGIDLVMDIQSRMVSLVGEEDSEKPVFSIKRGDIVMTNLRLKKRDFPLDLNPFSIKFAFKELETEAVIFESGGMEGTDWSRSAEVGAGAVYYVPVAAVGPLAAAALSNYEKDEGTEFDALCEIELQISITPVGGVDTLVISSNSFRVRLARDLVV